MKKNLQKTIVIFFLIIISAFIFAACGSKNPISTESYRDFSGESPNAAFAPMLDMAIKESAYEYNDTASQAKAGSYDESAQIERMIVKSGILSIQVADPAYVADQITAIATKFNGFVVSSELHKSYSSDNPSGTVEIRVDATKFEAAIEEIEALVTDPEKYIRNKNIFGDDITDQYVDQESRLKSLEAKKAKLEEILDMAKTVKDTLSVYNEIASVNEEIEHVKGRMTYMEQSSRLSSLTINIESIPEPVVIAGYEWNIGDSFRQSINAFINTGQGFIDFILYFVISVLPFLIIIFLPIVLIIRWLIRRGKKSKKTANGSALSNEPKE